MAVAPLPAARAAPREWQVNNFDLVRLLAALQVALGHALSNLGSGGSGHLLRTVLALFPGVPVFFVVSGFLISRSYEHTPTLRIYLRNRALRIYPGLWVCLVATLGVIAVIGSAHATGTARDWLIWWASQMTVYQSRAIPLEDRWQIVNGSLWTIPVELEFYVLLPALYALCGLRRRRGGAALALLAVLSLLAQAAVLRWPVERQSTPLAPMLTVAPYLWMFLAGVLLQRYWVRVRPWLAGRALWWLAAYAGLCLLAYGLHIPVTRGSIAVNPLCFMVLAALTVSAAFTCPTLAARCLRGCDLSYGLYIYHMLVIALLIALGLRGGWAVGTVLGASMALGWLSYMVVERPFLARKRRALHPRSARAAGRPEHPDTGAGDRAAARPAP